MAFSDPDMKLSREDTARALTEAGYPTAYTTLATFAYKGTGPDYEIYGNRAWYRWGSSLKWAESRVKPAPRPYRIADLEEERAA